MLRRAAPSQPDATGDSATANDQSTASPNVDRTAFLLLLTCAALINSDQNLLSPNMSACADDFGFTKLPPPLPSAWLPTAPCEE